MRSKRHQNHQSVHVIQWPNQFLFNSTAKIAPRMHQKPFWAQKSEKLLMAASPIGEGDTPSPRPTPSAPWAPRSSCLRRSSSNL